MSPSVQGIIVLVATILILMSGIPVAFGLGALAIAHRAVDEVQQPVLVPVDELREGTLLPIQESGHDRRVVKRAELLPN